MMIGAGRMSVKDNKSSRSSHHHSTLPHQQEGRQVSSDLCIPESLSEDATHSKGRSSPPQVWQMQAHPEACLPMDGS